MERVQIFATGQFEAVHHWPTAPDKYAYLRNIHRHIFHFRAVKLVSKSREIEFIEFKRNIQRRVSEMLKDHGSMVASWSCEEWAKFLAHEFSLDSCEVSEDLENGAIVTP